MRLLPDRSLLLWVLGWCLSVFALAYGVENPFFALLLLLPIAAVGIGLLIFGLWRGWELRHSPVAALATALLFPAAFWSWPLIAHAAQWAHFAQDRPVYDQIRRMAAAGAFESEDLRPLQHQGVVFDIEGSAGVKRFAFTTNAGVVDNWAAVIYDPSDQVRLARGMGSAPPHVEKLFGGDLVACRWLANHYYSCSFT
ncbi:MAG TPA: hypothetical protein VGR19_12275 [Allosphingosinicella sp.]|nr:hypothetical protein [Allosphingosinicella sp.]